MYFHKGSHKREEYFGSKHRFEHWYRDNTIYFITARCRNQYPAFRTERAKAIFWNRFDHYTSEFSFKPFVTSLLDNHYHTLGHLKTGITLPLMMQRIHGSVAKLVNDVIAEDGEVRLLPFWIDKGHQNYYDGCIRDEKQCRRAYRYTREQAVRHGVVSGAEDYLHTVVRAGIDAVVDRALSLDVFLKRVPYARYDRLRNGSNGGG